jgi:hypothetical protein
MAAFIRELFVGFVCACALMSCEHRPIGVTLPDAQACHIGWPVPIDSDPSCTRAGLQTVIRYFECESDATAYASHQDVLWVERVTTSRGFHIGYCCQYPCID